MRNTETIKRLLAATPADRRSYVFNILGHARNDADAERVWNILRRQQFQPVYVETPWLDMPCDIPAFSIRYSDHIARKEGYQ